MSQGSTLNEFLNALTDRSRFFMPQRRVRRAVSTDVLELCDAMLTGRGEASGAVRARDALAAYQQLDYAGKTSFFRALAQKYGPDETALKDAALRYMEASNPATAKALQRAAEPRRQELLRRLNLAPGGTAALVAMRVELLERLGHHPEFWTIDDDFVELFSAWFNRGFLLLRRIDWQTSASILEKIIHYEAVHEIKDWNDLRRRIDLPDRRLYAFFHPRLGDDPVIFVEVALTNELPGAIAPILAADREPIDPAHASTAVFYSISNCQKGLRGISFGNFLIKQVAEDLGRELRQLKTFVTLSPLSGFSRWLAEQSADQEGPLGEAARGVIAQTTGTDWVNDAELSDKLARQIKPLVSVYLTRSRDAKGRVPDPVARFHLGNGARLERINWMADLSSRELSGAYGVMINYLYDLDDIEKNHEAFVNEGKVVAASSVTRLARQLKTGENRTAKTEKAERGETTDKAEAQTMPERRALPAPSSQIADPPSAD